MNKVLVILPLGISLTAASGQELSTDMEEFWKTIREGALARITLRIIDEDGMPVDKANVGAHFEIENRDGIEGQSDATVCLLWKISREGSSIMGSRKKGITRPATRFICFMGGF